LESLRNERKKQREKLLGRLAEKDSRLTNPADIAALEKSTQQALDQMNKDFDDKEASALRRAQEEVLLALSSIYIDEGLLQPAPVIAAKDDVEVAYFEEESPEAARIAKATDWLSRVEQIKGTYMSASQELQQSLRQAHREASSEMEGGAFSRIGNESGSVSSTAVDAPNDAFSGVTTHMMKVPQPFILRLRNATTKFCIVRWCLQVITEAFDSQISDRGQEDGSDNIYVQKETTNAQRAADAERVRAG
jgi:hypothetical protein